MTFRGRISLETRCADRRGPPPRLRRSWRTQRLALVALAAANLLSAAAMGQCYYTYETVQNPPGWRAHANAINDLGQVAGQLDNGGAYSRAFIWSHDGGTFQIPHPPGTLGSVAYDINNLGHVVGQMIITGLGGVGFYWDGTAVHILEVPPGVNDTEAHAINDADQIAGQFIHSSNQMHACTWLNGSFVDLGPLLSTMSSSTSDINELGEIAGYISFPNHGFRTDGELVDWFPEPAGIWGSYADGLNNNGVVAGHLLIGNWDDFFVKGYYWRGDDVAVIEPFDGARDAFLLSVNDAGRAVGDLRRPGRGPIVWQSGVVTNLLTAVVPDVPAGLRNATDISGSGKICAWTSTGSVVLTPTWIVADLTGDCSVTIEDLIVLLSHFGCSRGTFPRGDVDLDGDVDLADLAALLSDWGS